MHEDNHYKKSQYNCTQYMHTYNYIQNIDSCSLYPVEIYEVNVYVTVQYINHISIINFEILKVFINVKYDI